MREFNSPKFKKKQLRRGQLLAKGRMMERNLAMAHKQQLAKRKTRQSEKHKIDSLFG